MSRAQIHAPRHLGDTIADGVASSIGSWNFIIIQAVLMAAWIVLNTAGWFIWKWDLYPFVFLNLAMSAEAAFTAPIIMISQNRQASREKARDDLEAEEVASLFSSHELLLTINKQQLEILELLKPAEKQETT